MGGGRVVALSVVTHISVRIVDKEHATPASTIVTKLIVWYAFMQDCVCIFARRVAVRCAGGRKYVFISGRRICVSTVWDRKCVSIIGEEVAVGNVGAPRFVFIIATRVFVKNVVDLKYACIID